MLHLGALSTLKDWWRTNHTNSLNSDSLVCDFSCTCVVTFKPIHHLTSILLSLLLWLNFLRQVGSVNGNPSGSLLENRSKKAYLEEWIYTGDDSSDEQGFANFSALVQSTGNKGYIRDDAPPPPRPARQPDEDKAYFWERNEAPLPPLWSRCNFIHPRQLSPFLERLKLPFPIDEILSGFEEIVSSGTDQFTAWVKTDPHDTLVQHMVDVQNAVAEFREASERRHDASSQTNRFTKTLSTRSPVRKRLSVYNWNPGPRRGRDDAFEKQIAVKWHIVTLQEASDYVDHDFLQERFQGIYWNTSTCRNLRRDRFAFRTHDTCTA